MTKPVLVSGQRGANRGRTNAGRWIVVFAVIVIAITAVAFVLFPRPACACVPIPASPVDGIVTDVQATGLTDIQSFTLRPNVDGAPAIVFMLGPLENPTEFPPGHLKAHQLTGAPVRVYYATDSTGRFFAYRLEDAPVPSASPASAPSSSP
jgi:hypothetical protein